MRESIDADNLEWEGKHEGIPNPHYNHQDDLRDEIDGVQSKHTEEDWINGIRRKKKGGGVKATRKEQEVMFNRALYNATHVPTWEEVPDGEDGVNQYGLIHNTPTATLLTPKRELNDTITDVDAGVDGAGAGAGPTVTFGGDIVSAPGTMTAGKEDGGGGAGGGAGKKALLDGALWTRHPSLSTKFVRSLALTLAFLLSLYPPLSLSLLL